MATGETKKFLNSPANSSKKGSLDYSVAYDDKKTSTEILRLPAAKISELWQGKNVKGIESLGQFYFGDNLTILSYLCSQKSLKGRVGLIYIDPPYATNQVFVSRDRAGGYHDLVIGAHYIEFLRERLVLLRELLADDGSIYVHLDDNMAFEIKLIMDEVFGKKNFRNFIVRKKSNPKNYTRKQFGNIADYILFYSKTSGYKWNRAYNSWLPEEAEKEYPYIEKETGRRYKKVPIHAPGVRNGDTGLPWKGLTPPQGKHWQYKRSTLDELDSKGAIYWSRNGNPRRKIYLDENMGIPIQDVWMDVKDAHNQNIKITGYPTEKNPALLERIIRASSNPGDIVLDCFSGSGTTLGVAADNGRRWIGIDNSIEAVNATLTRFMHGLQPMGDYVAKKAVQPDTFEALEAEKYISTMKFCAEVQYANNPELKAQIKRLEKFN
jgi:adenine-specific DNA-methyltransferase